ncbi:MAG TPA: hypothetical protein VG963_22845, partial [Polyangiaceae bacterium]|nr:hypothetical protein [Polyangiaceae bacterium]
DPSNAGAHYVLALCRENAGDQPAAIDRHRRAVYLAPGFSLPRMRLGLLARRNGDREGARRELGQALHLLAAEDAALLRLFGGGFGREALMAMCRAELSAVGGNT